MTGHTHVVAALVLGLLAIPTADAGQQRPSTSGLVDRVRTETTVDLEDPTPGGKVVLKLEVRPAAKTRVFAIGAKDFTPVMVVLSKPKGIKGGMPMYDAPEKQENPGNLKKVPLYARSFTIKNTVAIDKDVKPGTIIHVNGALTYQTCDDRNVFPRRTLPVQWSFEVQEPRASKKVTTD